MTYDSTADTLKHSQRVGELMAQPVRELVERSMCHDRSKTKPPELEVFNEYTPKLRDSTYGSEEYKRYLVRDIAHHLCPVRCRVGCPTRLPVEPGKVASRRPHRPRGQTR